MRDFALLSSIDSEPASGIVYYVTTSVEDRLVPKSDSYVRGHVYLEGWVFEPNFDTVGRTRSVQVTYISHVDLCQPIIQRSQESLQRLVFQNAVRISNIETFLNHYGCPPYIRRVAGKVSKETFETSKRMYGVAFIVKHTSSIPEEEKEVAWCTDIRVHASMFPSGYRIHVSPQKGVRVDLRQDCAGIRVYSTLPDMDGSMLTINIIPQDDGRSDKTSVITCNNVPLPPGGSYPAEPVNNNLPAVSDDSSISSDSQYQDAITDNDNTVDNTSSNDNTFSTSSPENPPDIARLQDSPPPSYNNTMKSNQESEGEEEEAGEEMTQAGNEMKDMNGNLKMSL